MKKITPKQHGYLDYVTVFIFLISPTLFDLLGLTATIAYILASIHLLMTLITDFPLGAVKLLPFTVHGWVERIVGPVLIILPFPLGFYPSAKVFYIVMGIIIIVVGLITNYRDTAS